MAKAKAKAGYYGNKREQTKRAKILSNKVVASHSNRNPFFIAFAQVAQVGESFAT